jgi:hypothetical protein
MTSKDSGSTTTINRETADRLFSLGSHFEALDFYKLSIENNEPGMLYSYLNGSLAANVLQDFNLSLKWLKSAKLIANNDKNYFFDRCGILLLDYFSQAGIDFFYKAGQELDFSVNKDAFKNIEVFILGIPRCGTTAVSEAISQRYNLSSGLSQEPLSLVAPQLHEHDMTLLYSILFCFAPSLNLFSNTSSENTKENFIEKSTILSLSRPLMENLIANFPKAKKIILLRDPIDRMVSAYSSCSNFKKYTFFEALEIELSLISNLGGLSKIFNNLQLLLKLLEQMAAISLNHLILYPSLILVYKKELFGDLLNRSDFFVIDIFSNSNSYDDMPLFSNSLNIKNSSNKSKSLFGDDEIEKLSGFLSHYN